MKSNASNCCLFVAFFLFFSIHTGTLEAFTLPATGQTKCYNATQQITCPQPGEAYYGQDGNYQKGATMSYKENTGNESGTVTDLVTGLTWQKELSGKMTWSQANLYCSELNFANNNDWRLPSLKELSTIVDYGTTYPALNAIFGTSYDNTWTSISDIQGSQNAWYIYFSTGTASICGKEYTLNVRCVRGNILPEPDFVDNTDGTITDNTTDLMWEKVESTQQKPWVDALAYCENQTTGSHTDWRLPNIREIVSILDYTKVRPALSSIFTQSATTTSDWSSTPATFFTLIGAFEASMATGSTLNTFPTTPYNMRCVRNNPSLTPVASLTNVPTSPTTKKTASITVSGDGIITYKYKLDTGTWSNEASVSTTLELSGLSIGQHTTSVVGKNASGVWQSTNTPTSTTWRIVSNIVPLVQILIAQ